MRTSPVFKKVVIFGPGLIGGSIGIALRQKKLAKCVVGIARRTSTISKAKKARSIDAGTRNFKSAVSGADLVILAAPVNSIKKIILKIKNHLADNCIIFDVGSTKAEIVSIAEKTLPEHVHFVGTHPMAGSEKAGAEFAREGLFKGSLCFIAKTKKTNKDALLRVRKIWSKLGARAVEINPHAHDEIVAAVSHIPHLVSVALVNSISEKLLGFSASGFKDMTRIAEGDPDIWTAICFSNKKAILKTITLFEKKLGLLKKSIKKNSNKLLKKQLLQAKIKRRNL